MYAWIVCASHVVATLADLKVHAKTPGHGKLLFDEAMFPKGYASNTREPRVFEIDMKTHKPTRSFGPLLVSRRGVGGGHGRQTERDFLQHGSAG